MNAPARHRTGSSTRVVCGKRSKNMRNPISVSSRPSSAPIHRCGPCPNPSVAPHVEPVGIGEPGQIPVRRAEREHHQLALRDLDAFQAVILGGEARCDRPERRLVPHDLLDAAREQTDHSVS